MQARPSFGGVHEHDGSGKAAVILLFIFLQIAAFAFNFIMNLKNAALYRKGAKQIKVLPAFLDKPVKRPPGGPEGDAPLFPLRSLRLFAFAVRFLG